MPDVTMVFISQHHELAKQLGTPDTCLSCHEDKTSQWSASKVAAWYPDSTIKEEKDFVAVFSAINLAINEQQLQGRDR